MADATLCTVVWRSLAEVEPLPVAPVAPCGMVKSSWTLVAVPTLVTTALLPGAPECVAATAMVGVAPVAPEGPVAPCAPVAP